MSEVKEKIQKVVVENAASLGTMQRTYVFCLLSFMFSYAKWKSVWWAILHGALGIYYLAYYIFYYTTILNQLK